MLILSIPINTCRLNICNDLKSLEKADDMKKLLPFFVAPDANGKWISEGWSKDKNDLGLDFPNVSSHKLLIFNLVRQK